jgi:signal recognition particle subunit SRP54
LDADVNFKTAKEFTDRVKAKALGQNVLTSVSPGQLLTKITNDELAELMGGKNAGINLSGNPTVVLMSGLQGSGKTTFSGKLANYIRKKGKKRAAHLPTYTGRPPSTSWKRWASSWISPCMQRAREQGPGKHREERYCVRQDQHGFTAVIIDTAGRRLAVDEKR